MTLDATDSESERVLAHRLLTYWQRELVAAPVADEPFQYFYCDHIWPQDVYEQILQNLPPHDLYVPLNIKQWVNAEGLSTRDRFLLTPANIERLDPERAAFWRRIVLALTSDAFKRLVFRKLKNDIARRLEVEADQAENAQVFVSCSLLRDVEDYKLKPHTDGVPRVVTSQFYFPSDDSQIDLGTSLYTEAPLLNRLFTKRFQEVKRMPFAPNSGYAFAVNNLPDHRSLHGRELIRHGAGVRNSMIVSWLTEEPEQRKTSTTSVVPTHDLVVA